ncbi:hypothetical protein DFH08DRAFT_1013377 [Mycena albidolilacea]|uniref:Uncharacterized protein n=1 Tax=Mycena albidolilacea TaxID=1033008 RepID=A0AAD6ZUR1_9AGAR|nr:hypothetical protein DFH08DRAFT_1013377 [Mycena albidolilacea]
MFPALHPLCFVYDFIFSTSAPHAHEADARLIAYSAPTGTGKDVHGLFAGAQAKIVRMSNDPKGAIAVVQRALETPQTFVQADTLLVFELALTLLAQRRHQEAADAFMKLTELNSWSHVTYYFIGAGCYVSIRTRTKAQELFDALPELFQRKKVGGKDLPTEVLINIRKKSESVPFIHSYTPSSFLEFYKEKQKRRGEDPAKFVECINIDPADDASVLLRILLMKSSVVWNTHQRINDAVAEAHITELAALTPPVAIPVPSPLLPIIDKKHNMQVRFRRLRPSCYVPTNLPRTPTHRTNELRALRAVLLGIMHCMLRLYPRARALLEAARSAQDVKISTWMAGMALLELAVTDLKEADGGANASASAKDKGRGEDSYRLPNGLVRTGYDADTSRYMYRNTETGESYIGAPGVEYGPLQLVVDERPLSRLLPHGEANKDTVEPFVLRPIPQKKRAPLVDGLRSIKYGTLPGAFRSLRRSLTRGTRRNLRPNEGPKVADAVDPCTPDVRPDEPTSPAPVLRPLDPAPTGTGQSPTSAD